MAKILVTDLDDTLYDWIGFFVPAFYSMVEKIVSLTGIPEKQLLEEYHCLHQQLGTVEYPYTTLRLPSIKAAFPDGDIQSMKDALRPAFVIFNQLRDENLRLFPGVESTLHALYQRGVSIIGYTESSVENGFYRLNRLGVCDYFQHVYALESSFKGGYASNSKVQTVRTRKPDTSVLLNICAKEGCTPDQVVYVGDSLMKDVYMAKQAGATAVWINRKRNITSLLDKLLAVTSWTEEDYAFERKLKALCEAGSMCPDFIIENYSSLLDLFGK